jgi:adenylylsulfate kinase
MMKSTNVLWQSGSIGLQQREALLGQKALCLWFTGLSGSGKSTLARAVEKELYERHRLAYVLDGDNVRHGLNGDLDFSEEDRRENIRRIAEVSKLFVDAGLIVLTAFISPFRAERELARGILTPDRFIEIYVQCSLETCEKRDVKGLYKKARNGEIHDFTGISSPYEPPLNPEIRVDSTREPVEESVRIIMNHLREKGYIKL